MHRKLIQKISILLCVAAVQVARGGNDTVLQQSANALMEQAQQLQELREYKASIRLLSQAVEFYEKASGSESLATAAALDLLGRGYRFEAEYDNAAKAVLRGLSIRKAALGEDDLLTASSLNNLAGIYYAKYDLRRAEQLYKRVLTIREKALGQMHRDTAMSLSNLGLLYALMGRYSDSEMLYRRAITIREKILGPDSLDLSDALTGLAGVYTRTGASSRAGPLLERALSIYEKALGPDHPLVAMALENMARESQSSGSLSRAISLQERALAIREKAQDPGHPELAQALQSLGNLYARVGSYKEAENVYLRSLSIREQKFGPNNLSAAYVLNDLAETYVAIGRYAEAASMLERALDIKERRGSFQESIATSLHDLAIARAHLGDSERAAAIFKRALEMRSSVLGIQDPRTAETINAYSMFNWARDGGNETLRLLQRAHSIQARNSEPFLMSGPESRKQAYLQMLSENTHKIVSFSIAVPTREGIALGVDSVLQYKGRVLDVVSDSVTRLRNSVQPEDRALFEQFTEVANQMSTLVYRGAGGDASYRTRIVELRARQDKLEAQLSTRSNAFREHLAPVTIASVRRAIPANAALIEWFRYLPFDPMSIMSQKPIPSFGEARYVAYVLRRNADPAVVEFGDAKSIERLIQNYRAALGNSNKDANNALSALSKLLLQPLIPTLNGTEHVLVSPDGALNLVPLGALTDDRGDYFASKHEITYITSGRDLLRMSSKPHFYDSDVVVADPSFGLPTYLVELATYSSSKRSLEMDRGGLLFRPLANTALEAQEIRNLLHLDDGRVLLRESATEANLRKLHGPRILHIASHGFFLSDQELSEDQKRRGLIDWQAALEGENPLMRSGIALSGANARHSGEHDDGILTALEAAQLDLHGTELVVLSACDTGVGQVMNGEGVYGLRRALVLAGSETQVTSLWKVSDDATRKLMVDYYQRLLNGEGRSDALRHAQLDMLAMPEYSDPYFWASFVSSGNWKPLSRSGMSGH